MSLSTPLTFVLVHGGWHTGAGWNAVRALLEAEGHQVFAPTLAGHGHGVDKRGITHADSTATVVDLFEHEHIEDAVLVGHSYGGTIIQKAVEAMPERVRRLVFWNAFVLEDGGCLDLEVPPHYNDMTEELAALSEDDSHVLPLPLAREAFFNSVDGATAERFWREYFSPQPAQPFRDKLDLKRFWSLDTPRSYVNCTEDTALPPGETTGWHPRMSRRLGLYRLVQLPGDHEALLTAPARLAAALVEAGRD